MRIPASSPQHGFSMIEVLVTMVIIATALLGTASLQLYAMRVNQGGQFRTQAVFLASNMAERMEANKQEAINGRYILANTTVADTPDTSCATNTCSAANLAAYDLNQWGNSIAELLPQPSWQISRITAGNPSTYNIIIRWTDRSSDKTSHGETFSYTATRTIGN